jgi:hypothetical protein
MRTTTTMTLGMAATCVVLLATGPALADSAGQPGRESGKPNPLKNVYFGEQHLHTANSPDAFSFGTRNMPDDSYRYCKGEAVKKSTGGADNLVKRHTLSDW